MDEACKAEVLQRGKKRKENLVEGEITGVSVQEEKTPQKKSRLLIFILLTRDLSCHHGTTPGRA